MVSDTMMSQPMQSGLRSQESVTNYTVNQTNTGSVRFPAYQQPTVQVCSSSRSARLARRTANIVTSRFGAVLYQMQVRKRVPAISLIRVVVVSKTNVVATADRPMLADIGMVLLGVTIAVALALWCDVLARSAKRSGSRHAKLR